MRRVAYLAMLAVGLGLIGWGAWTLGPGTPRHHITALAAEPKEIIPAAPFQNSTPNGTSLTGPATPGAPTGKAPVGERIRIPELNVDLAVIEGDGWNAPLYKAAHYPGLPWPGQGGRSVIYAHARPGMFGPLFDAKVGQRIEVSSDNGPLVRYQITEYYQHWPATDTRWLQPSDLDELILVTCTTYDPNDPRIIVVAKPV